MQDNWQIAVNEQPRRWKTERIYVSLNKRGEIVLNERAFREIGRPATVTLLYLPPPTTASSSTTSSADAAATPPHAAGEPEPPSSGRKGAIGVKFPVAVDRHFFPARRYGRGRRMRIVRAAKMLKQFGIEVTRTLVFPHVHVRKFRNEPMLVLELNRARELNGDQKGKEGKCESFVFKAVG